MKDILNLADRFPALGEPLPQVVAQLTWNPAREIQRPDLGNLSPGSPADIAVLSVEHGDFGFLEVANTRYPGHEKLTNELTVLGGKVIWDLNGISVDTWDVNHRSTDTALTARWSTLYQPALPPDRARFTVYPPLPAEKIL